MEDYGIALDQCEIFAPCQEALMWQPIQDLTDVPADREVGLAVFARGEFHALVFPCRRVGQSWVDAKSGRSVDIRPTHWKEWPPETAKS